MKKYGERYSTPEFQEKARKMVAFRRGFHVACTEETIQDVFGNEIVLVDGPASMRIVISNSDTTAKLCYGRNDYKGYIKIVDVIMSKGGAFTYLAADGKTSIYVGETIEIKENE